MPDESSQLEEPPQPVQPPQPGAQADTERKHRKLDSEEFKAKLEMTKAFCDTAKGYVQISSAGLALPLLFQQAMLGKVRSENGLLGSYPWELIASWALFLIAIVCGLLYQWLSMRRLWDQYHMGNRTPENMHEPGYRVTAARNDLEGTVAFYADEAVVLPPNAPIATDRQSIRQSWAGLLGSNTAVSWKVSKVEVAKSGELGYLYGTYSLSIQYPKGGQPVRDTGKLVEIWKKQVDGKWKCIVDIYNSDLPIAPAPKPKK